MNQQSETKTMRTLLLISLLLVFLHACCGSILILTGFRGFVPVYWVRSMLKVIPEQYHSGFGIWLTAAIGSLHLIPVGLNFSKHRGRYRWAMAGSCMLLLLISVEGLIAHQENRFQMLLGLEAACTLLLAYTLEKEEEKTSSGAIIIKMKSRKRKNGYPATYNPTP